MTLELTNEIKTLEKKFYQQLQEKILNKQVKIHVSLNGTITIDDFKPSHQIIVFKESGVSCYRLQVTFLRQSTDYYLTPSEFPGLCNVFNDLIETDHLKQSIKKLKRLIGEE